MLVVSLLFIIFTKTLVAASISYAATEDTATFTEICPQYLTHTNKNNTMEEEKPEKPSHTALYIKVGPESRRSGFVRFIIRVCHTIHTCFASCLWCLGESLRMIDNA